LPSYSSDQCFFQKALPNFASKLTVNIIVDLEVFLEGASHWRGRNARQ
jgi:hypothetical protein